MLGSVPADWFMRKKLLKLTADLNHIPPAIWDEYVRQDSPLERDRFEPSVPLYMLTVSDPR